MKESMMKNQVSVFHQKKMTKRTYHVYFEDKCIFKNLNEDEFDLIWGRIYRSYFQNDLTYEYVEDDIITDLNTEHSY